MHVERRIDLTQLTAYAELSGVLSSPQLERMIYLQECGWQAVMLRQQEVQAPPMVLVRSPQGAVWLEIDELGAVLHYPVIAEQNMG